MMRDEHDLHLKLLMLGDSGVGKTCLLLRYAQNDYSPSYITTIGVDFKVMKADIDGLRVKLQIWDTAGQEKFRAITTSYFKGSHAIMLVYDIADQDSFKNTNRWIRSIREHADSHTNVILLGNKCDDESKRVVPYADGKELAKTNNMQFFEVSAKSNINVAEAYMAIAVETKRRMMGEPIKTEGLKLDGRRSSASSCC